MTKMFHVVLRLWDQRYLGNIIFTYHSNGLAGQIKGNGCVILPLHTMLWFI